MFRYWKSHLALALLLVVIWLPSSSSAEDWVSKQSARTSLHRAIKFFRDHCSAGGGYIFRVSADLSKREGEGVVGESTAWLEPPATPTVGMAYLRAFQLTGEQVCLEAAVETAEALLQAGEAQRLKLAGYLSTASRNRTLFILDEPTTGLHFKDVVQLLDCFEALLSVGHSLIVVEHNLQLMKAADYIIDMGPGAADEGGQIVAQGTPEEVAKDPNSLTGKFLAEALQSEIKIT